MMPMEITPLVPLILRGILKERILILKGIIEGESLYLRGDEKPLIFKRELAGKTGLLRFWTS
jgi:hypothetical protein